MPDCPAATHPERVNAASIDCSPESVLVWFSASSAAARSWARWRGRPLGAAPAPAPLAPPPITVLTSKAGVERGLIFVAPKTTPTASIQQGPEIVDDQGRPVWFQAVGPNQQAANFRVQEYRGQPVLTWSGRAKTDPTGPGEGQGIVDYVYDRAYHQ